VGTLPSGTVTFLFTDVAGSTRMWESDRPAMESSLAVHDRILREVIEAHDGAVFATAGDSFSAAFRTAVDAVEAAAEAQLRLCSESWVGQPITVRMGLHTGVAEERDDNYYGPEVTRAARIMSVGHGGQVLLSETTAGLVRDLIAHPLSLKDLGTHDLKGLERSEHFFEVCHPALPVIEEPLATTSTRRSHLPEPLTTFVGRGAELATVSDLIDSSRVVTLTGVGGTGKTRLALESARRKAGDFGDGVWMAELASITDPDLVLTRIADVWGLKPGESAGLMKVVSTFLSTRQLLLMVDNCEHVLDAVASIVGDLLAVCPGLKVLATSRESLGVPGEAVYRVPSMSLGDERGPVMASDAVALFLDRFASTRPDYAPSAADLEAIVLVCRRLDGIPLGLELAAARLRSMSPSELADRLVESFRILTGASKTALPRQRTLQATIDWSYDLLDPTEQTLFRWASCFVGGFDLDAVTALAADIGLDDWVVLETMDQLVDKSLFTLTVGGRGTRFRMLEPIRQYAQDRLASEGEAEGAHSAHAGYYARLVARTEPDLRGPEQKAAHDRLLLELDNIRSALAELRDAGRIEEFLRMCFDLGIFWSQASMQIEALEVLHTVLDTDPDTDPLLLTRGWWVACLLAFNLTDPKSVDYGMKAIAAAEASGDEASIAWACLITAAAMAGTTSRDDARELFERGERILEANPDLAWWDPEWDRAFYGWTHLFVRIRSKEARRADLSRTVELARARGDMFAAAGAMTGAFFLREDDDDAEVLALLEESVRILESFGWRHALGHALLYWGWMTRDRDDADSGAVALARGATMLAEIGDLPCAIDNTVRLAEHFVDEAMVDAALPHLAFASRQARSGSPGFVTRIADVACRAAALSGDSDLASVLAAFLEAEAVPDGVTAQDPSPSKQPLLRDQDVLDMVLAWASPAGS
jgi:predicted ATPase/class 3 adenylate cyclase